MPATPPAVARTAAASPATEHPLAASIATVDGAVDWRTFRLGVPRADGWVRCDAVLREPDFFTGWRKAVAERLLGEHESVPDRTPAGYVLQWYLGMAAYPGAMLFHHARRVPGLEPRRLAFHLDPVVISAVALRPGRFWCLDDDPDAGHPDAVVVDDEVALAAVLRREVVTHAARFLRVYRPTVRFGSHTLWAAVTDVLDTGLLLAGRSRGDDEAGAADARLVLAERYAPLTAASTTRALTDAGGRVHWTRQRGSCCFYYALPGVPQACATCPRVDDTERARILGGPCSD